MSDFNITIFLVALVLFLSILIFFLLLKYTSIRRRIKEINKEMEADKQNLEMVVKERTHNLEKIRDSISEYAVSKSELAQDLEAKNIEILKQKDDLFKQSEKLKIAYEEIKKLESYRQQMTRMIIHDLKNPLNLIINIAESDNIPVKSGKMIRKLSWGMLDLIMNILEVNKLENMRVKIKMNSFDLASYINKLLEKFSFILSNSSMILKSNIPGDICIYGDIQMTGRIFDNLISNAIKYTPAGGIIAISAVVENDYIRTEVRDNGAGIPQNIMNEVFNEYIHGENRSFAYSNPTGIGLAYCKLAVEAMGGSIGISSSEGEGTTVWFKLMKGSPGKMDPEKDERTAVNQVGSGNLFPDLTAKEREDLRPVINELEKTDIDELSMIIKILDENIPDSNGNLAFWKEQVLKAAYSGDLILFQELLQLYKCD